jgi:hypothetical protein
MISLHFLFFLKWWKLEFPEPALLDQKRQARAGHYHAVRKEVILAHGCQAGVYTRRAGLSIAAGEKKQLGPRRAGERGLYFPGKHAR